jgi:subfamily B ATP-binding cassette protein MsbA
MNDDPSAAASADASLRHVLGEYFGFFRRFAGGRMYLFVLLTVLASNAEAFGIGLFLPLFSENITAGHDRLSRTVVAIMRACHLPLTINGALPVIVAVFFVRGLLQFAAGAYQYLVSSEMTRELREQLVTRLSQADYRYILSTNAGTLTNIVGTEVTRATSAFTYFGRLVPSLINIVVLFLAVVLVSWRLTLVVLGAAVVVLVLWRAPGRWTKHYSIRSTAENSRLTGLVIQSVQAFKYLTATRSFAPLDRKIFASATELAHVVRRIGFFSSMTTGLSQPLMALLLAAILYFRGSLVGPTTAPVIVLLVYLYRIMTEVFTAQSNWQDVCSFLGGLEAVRATFDELDRHAERRGGAPFTQLTDGLELRQVSFAFGAEPVLRDIDLRIARRTTVALVGESGAGKSTLVDLLTGLLKPTRGAVLVDGRDLGEIDLATLRARVGYVPQESTVFDDTVANNISLWTCDPRDPDGRERVRAAARAAHCEEFIAAMPEQYDSIIGERGVKLSGGQRQRLAIAKELFKRPDILILDEATSALDSESETLIQRSIDDLRGHMTIIIIAHRLSTVRHCDRLFVLNEGRVVEEGTFDELHARVDSRFRRLCELQNLS